MHETSDFHGDSSLWRKQHNSREDSSTNSNDFSSEVLERYFSKLITELTPEQGKEQPLPTPA